MRERVRPGVEMKLLDMTPDGRFVPEGKPVRLGWSAKLGLGAALVAVIATGLAIAAFFLWVASLLIPVALIAAVVAYGAFRLQAWHAK